MYILFKRYLFSVNVIRMEPAPVPTQLPVKIISAEQNRSTYLKIGNYWVGILLFNTILNVVVNTRD